jgi:hypothetical protein
MNPKSYLAIAGLLSVALPALAAQTPVPESSATKNSDPETTYFDSPYNVRPSVTPVDLRIAQRAAQILNSPAKWDRADTRVCRVKQCKNGCPAAAKTFSLYCALEKATDELSGKFEHRGAAMQEARFVVDEVAAHRADFQHRLQGYNNDPRTTFADIENVLRLLEVRIRTRLAVNQPD